MAEIEEMPTFGSKGGGGGGGGVEGEDSPRVMRHQPLPSGKEHLRSTGLHSDSTSSLGTDDEILTNGIIEKGGVPFDSGTVTTEGGVPGKLSVTEGPEERRFSRQNSDCGAGDGGKVAAVDGQVGEKPPDATEVSMIHISCLSSTMWSFNDARFFNTVQLMISLSLSLCRNR